jgi:hypothetical protein
MEVIRTSLEVDLKLAQWVPTVYPNEMGYLVMAVTVYPRNDKRRKLKYASSLHTGLLFLRYDSDKVFRVYTEDGTLAKQYYWMDTTPALLVYGCIHVDKRIMVINRGDIGDMMEPVWIRFYDDVTSTRMVAFLKSIDKHVMIK